jgi:hypothetical protein
VSTDRARSGELGGERVVTLPLDLLRSEILLRGSAVPESALLEIVDDVFLPLVMSPVAFRKSER